MTPRKHLSLLIQSVVIWALFWVAGWPDYYQQYSTASISVACTILSVLISLAAIRILQRSRPEHRRARLLVLGVLHGDLRTA